MTATVNQDSRISVSLPLPEPVQVRSFKGYRIDAVTVKYEVSHWPNEITKKFVSTTVFAENHDNTTFYTLTDLSHDIPDAPQWFLDAAEAMLAEMGEGR